MKLLEGVIDMNEENKKEKIEKLKLNGTVIVKEHGSMAKTFSLKSDLSARAEVITESVGQSKPTQIICKLVKKGKYGLILYLAAICLKNLNDKIMES